MSGNNNKTNMMSFWFELISYKKHFHSLVTVKLYAQKNVLWKFCGVP